MLTKTNASFLSHFNSFVPKISFRPKRNRVLILCLELIREAGASADEVSAECYERYQKKLTELIRENG